MKFDQHDSAVFGQLKGKLARSISPLERLWQTAQVKLRPLTSGLEVIVANPWFRRLYPVFGLLTLLGTTTFWAILGARLNMQNADQLVNPYLFDSAATFQQSLIPGSHSFLLKWPLFWLIHILGYTPTAYIAVTVATVLIAVATLAYILYRIEQRPLVYGTVLLALASILMLVPTTSYAGALLPVNMAMLTTRNIEYVIFIAGLAAIMRAKRLRSGSLWLGIFILIILIASDKLFLYLSIGGALLALTAYGLANGWNLVGTTARWVLGSVLAALGASGVLALLTSRHLTHIANGGGVGPYGVARSAHELVLGATYGVLHILTNFGANPASQTTLLHGVPANILHNLFGWAGIAYVINFIIFITTLVGAYQIIRHSLAHNKDKNIWLSHSAKLSIALIWVAVAAGIIFVASNHYYAADARYLTIVLFSLFIAGVTYLSHKEPPAKTLVIFGAVCFIGMGLGIPAVTQQYWTGQAVLASTQSRNQRIGQALKQHAVKVLVGDYWRVIPIKSLAPNDMTVLPLATCTTPRDTLSSKMWQPDLNKNSFAYVLTFDGSATDFPQCTLKQITTAYGRPNASVVTVGTITSPKEVVLFYDRGAHKSAPIIRIDKPSTVVPVNLDELPYTTCKQPTTMNIVAHQDDDLLFMNPDIAHDLQAGNCVRTVYVTAGDAGWNIFYWLGREQGSQAAYSSMLGFHDIWVQRVVRIGTNQYATIANPRGNAKVSLIYLHMPDGNLRGQGFSTHSNESLEALDAGSIRNIHDVYNGSAYSKDQVIEILKTLMTTYQPSEIHTQSNFTPKGYNDHSDHMAVGRLTQAAYQAYEIEHYANRVVIPLKFYAGYTVHALPANLYGADLQTKEDAFAAYSQFDGSVCHPIARCHSDPAYGIYLPRQYQRPY